MKLYADPEKYLTKKMQILAKYSGIDVEVPPSSSATVLGKTPILETDKGSLFSSGAICRHLSRMRRDVGLYGQNLMESGYIDSWTEFCTFELEVPLCTWVYSVTGKMKVAPEHVARAKTDTMQALAIIDKHLLTNMYMVGHQITLADVSVCCALIDGIKLVELPSFINLLRWFKTCVGQPEFETVLGKVEVAPAGGPTKPTAAKAAKSDKGKKDASAQAVTCQAVASGTDAGVQAKSAGTDAGSQAVASGTDAGSQATAAGTEAGVQAEEASPKKAAAKKEGKKAAEKKEAAPKKEGKKDKKKEEPKADEPKEPSPEELEAERKKKIKKVVKEGGKRGVEIEGAADMGGLAYFCTSVDEPEGDLELLDMCMTAMNAKSDPTEEERKGGSGHIGKMLFSAGDDKLAIVAYVPEEKKDELDASEWIKKVLDLNGGELCEGSTGVYAKGFVKADGDKNKFPLKMKEPSITEAISFLKSKGLFPDKDDSDDDDMVFGDDDFPS